MDRTYRVVGVEPDISEQRFVQVIADFGSPIEPRAKEAYRRIVKLRISPRVMLAMAIHDSSLCTAGINVTHDTRNPGNTRTLSLPHTIDMQSREYLITGRGTKARTVDTPKNQFIQFDDFADGFEDMAYRLIAPHYPYKKAGATTLETIIPIYAPTRDGNSPENYIRQTLANMRGFDMGPNRYSNIDGLPVFWLPAPPSNWNSGHGPYEVIVIHDIEGSAASAMSDGVFMNPSRGASTHFITDPIEQRIVQMVGTHASAWTAGNNKGNDNGINIENPGFASRPYDPKVVNYCGRLTGVLARDFGIPLVRLNFEQANTPGVKGVCGHQDFIQRGPRSQWHHDPGPLWPWNDMMAIARNVAGGGTGVIEPPASGPFFPETGFGISGGFSACHSANGGIRVFGYPISREFDIQENGKPVRLQWFERARFEWSPGRYPDNFDVTWTRLADVLLNATPDELLAFRFHKNDAGFRWAFTPMSREQWNASGHNMPPEMSLF